MRRVHIGNISPGAKLAKAVFDPDGRVLLSSGIELKEYNIDRLQSNSVSEIFVDDGFSIEVEVRDAVCEQTGLEAKLLFNKITESNTFSKVLKTIRIKKGIYSIIDELLSNRSVLANLSTIKLGDNYTFEHSVNVCALSLMIGANLDYDTHQLRDLGMGALLHDIGKLRIPEEILQKPSQLTVEEFEEIKKHTLYGYEILNNNKNISSVSAGIALGHHERIDGSGYPYQLRGGYIHRYARIVAVADVFDALTSDRVYRKKLRTHEVFEYITSLGPHHFDTEIVKCFVKYVTIYPVGMGVVLNTGERGIVTKVSSNVPTRPVVKVVFDSMGRKLDKSYNVNLENKLNVFIAESCEL